jgi:hypothetical protein
MRIKIIWPAMLSCVATGAALAIAAAPPAMAEPHGGTGGGHDGSGGWHAVWGGPPWGPWYGNDAFGGGGNGGPRQPSMSTWPPGLGNYSSGTAGAPGSPIVTPVHPAAR